MQQFFFVLAGSQDSPLEFYASVLANNAGEAVDILRSQLDDMTGDDLGIQIPVTDDRITRLMIGINAARITEDEITETDDETGMQWDGEEISTNSGRPEQREAGMKETSQLDDTTAADRFTLAIKRRQSRWEPQSNRSARKLEFRVAEKGGVSVYGLNRFPTTLYYEQWAKLLDVGDELRRFLEENKAKLKTKGQAIKPSLEDAD
ncbi:MAG TPA: hypothetical protein VJN69_11310 [Candidatus Acidoferrales bacterium]|nr:hypothetical protein [Candidatus Acidoferrales bacterium]